MVNGLHWLRGDSEKSELDGRLCLRTETGRRGGVDVALQLQ